MSRLIRFAVLIAIAIDLSGCASGNGKRTSVTSQESGRACSIVANRGWKEVQSDGFTFCVPQNWVLDARFESRHKMLYPSLFRMVSYTAPDTLQRVVFELPAGSGAKAELQQALERCGIDEPTARSVAIADGQGCSSGSTSWTLNAPQPIYTNVGNSRLAPPQNDFRPMTTITYSAPRIRVRAMGPGPTMGGVLNSVRVAPVP